MLTVNIVSLRKIEPLKTAVICQLGWDDKRQEIVILKGKRVGEQILKESFLDIRHPEKFQYISAKQGKDFIKNLCYGLCGSRIWAAWPREKKYQERKFKLIGEEEGTNGREI